jgi:mono/diheme cytochrome c family protein
MVGFVAIIVVFDKISKPTPVAGSIRFQDLMAPGTGILVTNCIKCHNSDKHEGGYDITNYEEMIANSVLVPGSTSSKMYQRISPSDPQYMNLSPMPLQPGAISTDEVRSIKQWIEEGALNN